LHRFEEGTALCERLRMGTDPPNQSERNRFERKQTMLNAMNLFPDDMQICGSEQVVCFADRTSDRILDW